MIKVLVVGQTPPPYGGQAIMIKKLLEGKFYRIQLFHVRLNFSKEIDDIGKFRSVKLLHLFNVIGKIIYMRFKHKIHILYYPPAGPDKIPMYRDLAILISTRWLFKHTIFHLHAGGISKLYPKLSIILKYFFRRAYFKADGVIRLSELNPPDSQKLKAKREFIIPNGIEDYYITQNTSRRRQNSAYEILFVGILRESKGILILLQAANIFRKRDLNFRLKIIGKFVSAQFRKTVFEKIALYELEKYVTFPGVLIGSEKREAFANADIFCFPSFFESETFGLVILEAMQFALPVVATKWRGIPSMIEDGKSGFLVPINDSQQLAEKIAILLKNPKKGQLMGKRGRQIYLEKFTVEKFWHNMEEAFISVG